MSSSSRTRFDQELTDLAHNLLVMGSAVEQQIRDAVTCLVNHDLKLAEQVIQNDDIVDHYHHQIEDESIRLFATQQPVASDLRTITTALKIIVDLERISDYAENIAQTAARLEDPSLLTPLADIPQMAQIAQTMLRDVLQAYVNRDISLAEEVYQTDDSVDQRYRNVFDTLRHLMESDPRNVYQGMELLLVARYLERIADHITNVADWVIYMVSGTHRRNHKNNGKAEA
ncbi:MAG: phosphate signaling complex protein PhoU [Firmicutes bacterium]|nr:phosphate signaling complex protein PhoU [Bacillota bacterium]